MPTRARDGPPQSHKPRRWGKPDRYTQAQVIQALQKAQGILTLTAELLGCNRDTVAAYRDKYPAVRKAWEEAPERVTDIAEGHLIRSVISGNPEEVRWWLRTKGRNRGYGDVVRQEVTGADGGPLQVHIDILERKLARILEAKVVTDALIQSD